MSAPAASSALGSCAALTDCDNVVASSTHLRLALYPTPPSPPRVGLSLADELAGDDGQRRAICDAVEGAGGDRGDAADLLAVWERLSADRRGRASRLRYEAEHPTCSCVDDGGGDDQGADRCARCAGHRRYSQCAFLLHALRVLPEPADAGAQVLARVEAIGDGLAGEIARMKREAKAAAIRASTSPQAAQHVAHLRALVTRCERARAETTTYTEAALVAHGFSPIRRPSGANDPNKE